MGTRGSYEAWSQTGHAHDLGIAACEGHTDLLLLGFAFVNSCSSTYSASQLENMGTSDDNTHWLCIVAASCDGKFSKRMASHPMHPSGKQQDERGDSQ